MRIALPLPGEDVAERLEQFCTFETASHRRAVVPKLLIVVDLQLAAVPDVLQHAFERCEELVEHPRLQASGEMGLCLTWAIRLAGAATFCHFRPGMPVE